MSVAMTYRRVIAAASKPLAAARGKLLGRARASAAAPKSVSEWEAEGGSVAKDPRRPLPPPTP